MNDLITSKQVAIIFMKSEKDVMRDLRESGISPTMKRNSKGFYESYYHKSQIISLLQKDGMKVKKKLNSVDGGITSSQKETKREYNSSSGIYAVLEIAEILGFSKSTIHKAIRDGDIKSAGKVKKGSPGPLAKKYPIEEIRAYLEDLHKAIIVDGRIEYEEKVKNLYTPSDIATLYTLSESSIRLIADIAGLKKYLKRGKGCLDVLDFDTVYSAEVSKNQTKEPRDKGLDDFVTTPELAKIIKRSHSFVSKKVKKNDNIRTNRVRWGAKRYKLMVSLPDFKREYPELFDKNIVKSSKGKYQQVPLKRPPHTTPSLIDSRIKLRYEIGGNKFSTIKDAEDYLKLSDERKELEDRIRQIEENMNKKTSKEDEK